MRRYVVSCQCGKIIAVTDDPPEPAAVAMLERHERGHREARLPIEADGKQRRGKLPSGAHVMGERA